MSLDSELKRLLGYHVDSPHFKYYEDLFFSKLDKMLYDCEISSTDYNRYKKLVEQYKSNFTLVTTVGINSVVDAYNKVIGKSYIMESCSIPMIRHLKYTSNHVLSMSEKSNYGKFTVEERLKYLVALLTKANSVMKNPNREVYFYLNKFKIAMLVAFRVHNMTDIMRHCFELYFDLYNQVISSDEDFYKEYGKSKTESLSGSSVFGSGDDFNYYDFLVTSSNFLKNLIIPSEDVKEYTKDKVLNFILSRNISNDAKDEYISSIMNVFEDIIFHKVRVMDGLVYYFTYGDDFIYLIDIETCESLVGFCKSIVLMCSPMELVKFCVFKADNLYMAENNSVYVFNNTLHEYLRKLEKFELIEDAQKVYDYLKR